MLHPLNYLQLLTVSFVLHLEAARSQNLGKPVPGQGQYVFNMCSGWWWLEPWNFMTFHVLGMSSSQLTFTPSFFRGVGWNHQPVFNEKGFLNLPSPSHPAKPLDMTGFLCVILSPSTGGWFRGCFTRLDCPSGYSLSDPVGICGQTDCGIENYAVSTMAESWDGTYLEGNYTRQCVKTLVPSEPQNSW